MLQPQDSALPCRVVARKLRNVPPTLPVPEDGPDPDMCVSEALPTSFNRGFDAIVLELISEHRRIITRSQWASHAGQLPPAWSDCGLSSEPNAIDEFCPLGLGQRGERAQAESVAAVSGAGGSGEARCIDDPACQGDAVKQEQNYMSEKVCNTPVETSQEMAGSSDPREVSRDVSEMAKPIRLRTTDSIHYNFCVSSGEAPAEHSPPQRSRTMHTVLSTPRHYVQRCVRHPAFEPTIGFVILLNAFVVGYDIQMASVALEHTPDKLFAYSQTGCNFVFLLEWICRVIVEGWRFFYKSDDLFWNWFDTMILVCSVLSEIAASLSEWSLSSQWSPTNVRIAKTFRLLRLLRVARISRLFGFVNALRVLVFSVLSTLRSLAWAMLLLFAIFYLFAAVLTQRATDYRIESSDQDMVDEATKYWGNLPVSMFTLFMSISGGVSWIEPVTPLHEIGPSSVVVFTLFITFTYFAALNVITGVFCQTAHETATEDHYNRLFQMEKTKRDLVTKMEEVFETCDTDRSGLLTLAELEAHIGDEQVRACFESLGIEVNDAFEVFRLLDADHSGGVDCADLIAGAIKLKGTARSIDVVQVQHDVKMLRYDIRAIAKAVNELVARSCS